MGGGFGAQGGFGGQAAQASLNPQVEQAARAAFDKADTSKSGQLGVDKTITAASEVLKQFGKPPINLLDFMMNIPTKDKDMNLQFSFEEFKDILRDYAK